SADDLSCCTVELNSWSRSHLLVTTVASVSKNSPHLATNARCTKVKTALAFDFAHRQLVERGETAGERHHLTVKTLPVELFDHAALSRFANRYCGVGMYEMQATPAR